MKKFRFFIYFLIFLICFLLSLLLFSNENNSIDTLSIKISNNTFDLDELNDTFETIINEKKDENIEDETIDKYTFDGVEYDSFEEMEKQVNLYMEIESQAFLDSQPIRENFDKEEGFNLIKEEIVLSNLDLTVEEEPFYQTNEKGIIDYYYIYQVNDNTSNEIIDKIAVNAETGELFGLTPENIFYNFELYPYSREWLEFDENTDWDNYGDRVPYEGQLAFNKIYNAINHELYPTSIFEKTVWTDGNEYYIWKTNMKQDYFLINYWSGSSYIVSNEIKEKVVLPQEEGIYLDGWE